MFSFDDYRVMMELIASSRRYMSYPEAMGQQEYIVMRHDVEFSLPSALRLAQVEHEFGIGSTYLFQLRNPAYNLLARQNLEQVEAIRQLGHTIGLHFYYEGPEDAALIGQELNAQAALLKSLIHQDIPVFSFHRPTKGMLQCDLRESGLINTYDPHLFTYTDDLSTLDTQCVKYIADSRHRWDYGMFTGQTLRDYARVQLLFHPFSWSEEGSGYDRCKEMVMLEKSAEFSRVYDTEMSGR